MDVTAVRHIDPAELPGLVLEAITIADSEIDDDADRAVLLPVILEILCRRTIVPPLPALIGAPGGLRLPPGLGGG